MAMIWLAILMVMQAGLPGRPPGSLAILSVCEVLAHDPTRLNGKVVRVKGFLGGTDEGIWLTEECQSHLVTKGLAWGNDLSVHVDLSDVDTSRAWGKMLEKLNQLHADMGRDKIQVTIVGRIETRASMDDEVVQMPYGLRRAGFGHMGGSPAEINVISIDDVAIEPRPASKPPR